MNTLKYSLSSRQTAEYLEQADEIRFEYRDRKAIPDFIAKYPTARINLVLSYDSSSETEIDWNEIYVNAKLAHDRFIVGIVNGTQLAAAREKGVHFYHRAPLYTFQELRDLYFAGANEVILGAPLFFQLDKISRYYPAFSIRAVANVALPEGSMSPNDGVCGTWIRPEDVPLYEQYVDTIEFFGEQTVEQALFRIYALQHRWSGELKQIVKDLDHDATNRMIPPTLAEARISCGQKCMMNNVCHLCHRTLDLAKPEMWSNYLKETENT